MSKVLRRRWYSPIDPGQPLELRKSCDYEAYVPDPLVGRAIVLDSDVAADVADAEAAIARLNAEVDALLDTEALARLLLRAEALTSARIEGPQGLGSIEAMLWAARVGSEAPRLTIDLLLDVQRRLLAGTPHEEHAGRLRTEQNWLGPRSENPCSAEFVPPPPEAVGALVEDLCAFCSDDSLPAVAQAGIAFAQFETIHPFSDGNGRVGRALIHMVLRRRRLAPRVLPPVSLVLTTWAQDYVAGLSATRYHAPATSRAAHAGLNRWVGFFASACMRAVGYAADYERRFGHCRAPRP